LKTSLSRGAALLMFLGLCLLPAAPAQAAFPGPNGNIAFSSDRAQSHFEIWTMAPNGAMPTRLTNNTVGDGHPAWSPDGRRIAFTRDNDIYVMNADGSGESNLTNDPAFDRFPAWSPDGTKIAFESQRSGDVDANIYTMNADGSNQVRLMNNTGALDSDPAWSPDGTKIAFITGQASPIPTSGQSTRMGPARSIWATTQPSTESRPGRQTGARSRSRPAATATTRSMQ
jgi:Tol biopolymer transport system component